MRTKVSNRTHSPVLRAAFFGAICLSVFAAGAGPVQLISARDPALPLPAGGNGDSVAPNLTPDGRFVVFSSSANNLVPAGDSYDDLNVFLRDHTLGTTVLVSAGFDGAGGGNAASMLGQASTNGQFVVFQSDASNLVPGDTNQASDVFIRDVAAGATELVSVSTNGGAANGPSTDPVMTPDGRYVAFISSASNLVPGDTDGIPDVFVRDMVAGTNCLVSVNARPPGSSGFNPVMATPAITPDGRYVAFFSSASNLAGSTPADSPGEVYLRDRAAGITIRASIQAAALASADLGLSGAISYDPSLSEDGRYVAFKAGSASSDGAALILRYDTATAETAVVSTNGIGSYIGFDDEEGPVMTPDGRFIAYAQREGSPSSGYSSLYIWDAEGATNILVSEDSSGSDPAGTTSDTPLLGAGGRLVVFRSGAAGLVTNSLSGAFHLFLRDRQSGSTELVDADTNGAGSSDETMTSPSLSAEGRLVAFDSPDGRLVGGDDNQMEDVFLRDAAAGTTALISQRDASAVLRAPDGNSSLSSSALSADGRWAAFSSAADDLVPGDTNRVRDVFVRDLVNGTNLLVSAGLDGGPALGGGSANAVISTNGRYVAFVSSATNLVAGVAGDYNNVFRRDLQTGATVLVSVSTNGVSGGNGDSTDPVISPDGRCVAFLSQADNLAPGAGAGTYWRDVDQGRTVAMPGPGAFKPSLAGDGRYVAYSAGDGFSVPFSLSIRDTQSGANRYIRLGSIFSVAMDPTGARVAYETGVGSSGTYALRVDDVAAGTNVFSITTQSPTPASWSDDGRWLTFVSDTNLSGGTDDLQKVYLKDLQTGTLSLLGPAGPAANGDAVSSDGPAISGDGRFVAYRSTVTNAAAGSASAPPGLFLFDRLTGSNTVLAARSSVPSLFFWFSRPLISDDGATVAFLNYGGGLADGDLNRHINAEAAWVDSDSSGIPDWWMRLYFGHPDGESGDGSLADDDADGDGLANWQEYLAGTSPVDAASAFRLRATMLTNHQPSLSWPTAPGRSYQLQYKTNLTDPAWLPVPGSVQISGGEGRYDLPIPGARRFYRVLVTR